MKYLLIAENNGSFFWNSPQMKSRSFQIYHPQRGFLKNKISCLQVPFKTVVVDLKWSCWSWADNFIVKKNSVTGIFHVIVQNNSEKKVRRGQTLSSFEHENKRLVESKLWKNWLLNLPWKHRICPIKLEWVKMKFSIKIKL